MMKKRLVSIGLLALLVLIIAPAALAQEERSGSVVIVEAAETIDDDLYASGELVVIDGRITGDLIVTASQTTINGVVEGDVLAVGQYLTVNGEVGGSVRSLGMTTSINSSAAVGKDVFVAGYSLYTAEGSVIEGDVRFFGGQGTLNGDVGGDVIVSGAGVTVNGSVGGDVKTEVGAETGTTPMPDFSQMIPGAPALPPITGGLQIGEGAEIAGQVQVTAPETVNLDAVRQRFPEAMITQTAVTVAPPANPWATALTRLISVLLVGVAFAWFRPAYVAELSDYLRTKPLPSAGWGALVYFLFPLFIVFLAGVFLLLALFFGLLSLDLIRNILFMTGFVVIAVILMTLILILLFLTKIIVGYVIGHFIISKIKSEWNEHTILPVLLGLVLVMLLISIPYLGALLNWIIAIVGLGALVVMQRTPKEPVEKSPEV
jgi:hypothetical protein